MLSKNVARAAVAGIATVGALAFGAPAHADSFQQNWNTSANYRASYDFVPTASTLKPEGLSCSGGAATKFYISLVKTSGSQLIWSSPSPAADGAWHVFSNHAVSVGTSYYFRWHGQNSSESNGYNSPCQGVFGAW